MRTDARSPSPLDAFVPRDDVDDAADRVRAVERRALRAANHFDAIDRARVEARDEQRVRDLDAVDVDLRIAEAERARAANAGVRAEQVDGDCAQPTRRARTVERAGERVRVVARELPPVDDVEPDRELALAARRPRFR